MNIADPAEQSIILFDGLCNLCNGSVAFIMAREKAPLFRFASIQSEAGSRLLERCGLPRDYDRGIVLIAGRNVFKGASAALKIGRQLRAPWSLLAHISILAPEFVRDWVYDQVAMHRYRWFGKREACRLPTDELKARFL